MEMKYFVQLFIIICLFAALSNIARAAGAKGQDFDRLVFESSADGEVTLTARVMTVNRHIDSASQITVLDNGAPVLGPEVTKTERWTRPFAVKGGGRHEVVLRCESLNSAPVYCRLSLDDARARVVE